MSPVLLASLLNTFGTVGIPLISKLIADINAGKTATSVTADDLAELSRLCALSGASIYAKAGVALPP